MQRNIYLERYALDKNYISTPPSPRLELSVVIPAYKEPDVVSTLTSLQKCTPIPSKTEVIVVFNYSDCDDESARRATLQQYEEALSWVQANPSEHLTIFSVLEEKIPCKIAGPGMARKIGMDEAVKRFETLGKSNGIIASLDADCKVQENYLAEIYAHWQRHPETNGVSIFFEHPLKGALNGLVYQAITAYELHLRYYIDAQRFAAFPLAFQTVGSSFAVSSATYQKQGGMNKRKAGEDFYFLQRIIPLGNYYDLNSTTVYPSPRPSDRVPFGTGRSISDFLAGNNKILTTYNIEIFSDLKQLLSSYEALFHCDHLTYEHWLNELPPSVRSFLRLQDFWKSLEKINENVSKEYTFSKAFFRWLDAFKLMKFVHFARDGYYPNQPVEEAAKALLKLKNIDFDSGIDATGLLSLFRTLNRSV